MESEECTKLFIKKGFTIRIDSNDERLCRVLRESEDAAILSIDHPKWPEAYIVIGKKEQVEAFKAIIGSMLDALTRIPWRGRWSGLGEGGEAEEDRGPP